MGLFTHRKKEVTEGRINIHQGRKELEVVVKNRNKCPDKNAGQL